MVNSEVFPYLPNSASEIKHKMLKEIGFSDISELYKDIPEKVRLKNKLNIPNSISEYEVEQKVEKLLSKNQSISEIPSFLGAGCWSHYVPAAVDSIIGRSEFATSYTPYQAETSQGILQTLFEYQSMICELTEMDYANSSMYDWSTALGEAARMAINVTGREEFLIPHYTDPDKVKVLKTYSEPAGLKIIQIEQNVNNGQIVIEALEKKITENTAAVYLENPSYLGFYEKNIEEISDLTHKKGGLLIAGVDPISLGIIRPPGDYDADIVIGEGQQLGNHMNYGGPSLGLFACSGSRLLRQMPGRIVGMTNTLDGKDEAYCLVHQTREQHIRRERATSNICTNEALCAVAAATYLALLGPEGLRKLCETIITKSHYAMKRLNEIKGIKAPLFDTQHFKEFTVNFDETGKKSKEIHDELLKKDIQGGKILTSFPELGDTALYCVTETHSRQAIDSLVNTLNDVLR
jgi:glycine dehydrogenase subunit 1